MRTATEGEVLYRWLFQQRQDLFSGAVLFLNRHRTGLKTGGQLHQARIARW